MTPINCIKRGCQALITTALFAFTSLTANAALIPAELQIDGTVTFDDGSSFGATTGSFSTTSGGVLSSSTFSGENAAGTNPLTLSASETGDGIGFLGSVNATDDEFLIGLDSVINITNTSLTDTIDIEFQLIFSNLVNTTGNDAYSDSEFVIQENGSEIFFTDLVSDSASGNSVGGVNTNDFGGELSDSDTKTYTRSLAPSEVLNFALIWTLEGGDYDSASASANFSQTFLIKSASIQSGPQPVPEPGTLILLAFSALLIGRKQFNK